MKGYEWTEGEWYGESDYEAVHLIVTQHYYQMTRWSDDETEEVIWDQERIPIEIKVREFSFSEPPISSLSIGYGIFISKKNRCLFTPLDDVRHIGEGERRGKQQRLARESTSKNLLCVISSCTVVDVVNQNVGVKE